MRCQRQKSITLPQRFRHKAEFTIFEIPQATVDHARGCGTATGREVVALYQKHPQSL